jgi:NtrC-family two-component system response regulator AlgB
MTQQPQSARRILVIDDEKNIRATLAVCLESMGYVVEQADRPEAALTMLERHHFELAFLDLRLGSRSGLDLLPQLLERAPDLVVVMVTAYGTIDTAVEAMKRGARDFVPKPFTPAQIRQLVERLTAQSELERKVANLQHQLSEAMPGVELSTNAPRMKAALEQVRKAAAHDVSILLLGESGTGKGVLAQFAHDLSPRQDRPFVVVNCPTLSEELLASELFGHTRGAFTGAVKDQAGRVEAADGGTLFLDEIGEIPAGTQAKLLRFLQEKRFERLGENQTRVADVRIIAATNRDIEAEVKAGRFREDLYFRLNTVEISLPPLRERTDDVLLLAENFIAFFAQSMRRRPPSLSEPVKKALLGYRWPGNVRELRNTIERAMIFAQGEVIGPEALPERMLGGPEIGPQVGGLFTLEQLERAHIERVVAQTPSLEEAARILGIDGSTLYRKRKRYEEG